MNIYYLFLIKLFSICFFIGGCLSSSSYKSASVEEGKGIFGQTLGLTAIQYPNENILNLPKINKNRYWPSYELFFQYGLSDSFELGMTSNFTGLIGDVKYQFFGGEVLEMAVDLGVGTALVQHVVDNETKWETYNSIYPAAIFTLNFSDKFRTSLSLEHKKSYNDNPEGEKSSTSFNGGSINIST